MSPKEVFKMGKRKRRAFSAEYKAEVVRLIVEGNRPLRQVCREMDLTETAVRRWVRQSEIDAGRGAEGSLSTLEREELARLRREVGQLRQERDILKKAAAFFAKESS